MHKNTNHAFHTHRSKLLSAIVLLTLVAIALATSIESDYAEALMPGRSLFGDGSSTKSSLVAQGRSKTVVKQATSGQEMSGSLSGGVQATPKQGASGSLSNGNTNAQPRTIINPPVSADASTRTLTQSILSDQGEELYVVTAIFGESAEIPYDAQLEVEERALTDDGKAILHRSLELTADHMTIYDTVLDVRLVANGVYVEPKTPIEIEIASTVIKPEDSYAVEIALLDGAQAVIVPVENLTGVDADNQIIEKPEYARLKINATKMGEFALSTVLAKKYIWPLEKETVTIWGPRSTSTSFQETPVNAKYAEGLTMLSRISAQVDPSTSWASNLWASAELNAGVTQGFDGVRCHVMNGEELGAEVFGPSGGVQPVALPVGSAYAFLWDDGYRTSTAEAGVVSFAGSMPLGVKVWADDVTASYADADAVVGIHDEMKYGYRTVTAFDARYEVKSDAWQPSAEHVVNATINVDGASATSDLQVWHVNKGGQYVQVPNVVVSDDTVAFAMDDDGVYILVERVSYERELAATDGVTYRVTVNYDKAAGLPDGLQLKVTEVASGTASNFDHVTQSLSVLGIKSTDVNYAKVLDIELVDPVTGMKYQPTDDVRVRIEILDADLAQSESVDVVHFGTRPEVVDTQLEGNDVFFAADGFSVYVVNAYTVDFHQGEYTYSIAGESEIALSELLEKLHVTEFALNDVTDVSFSNPALVEVTKLEAAEGEAPDWKLRSLAPFSTEETLTLVLTDGQGVEIRVTDVDYNVYNNSNAVIGSWTLDSEGTLTVTGTGAMKDYDKSPWVGSTPWFDYIVKDSTHSNPSVTKVVITDGITRIGTNSFTRTYKLHEIDASNCTTLTVVGSSAFKQQSSSSAQNNTGNPKIINFSGCENLTTIETDAFRDCKGIEELDISGTKLNANYITTAGAGFGASTTSLKTLRANGCTTNFSTLDLSGRTGLQTVEVSGCTGLTSLTLPNSVTTLDISGCTGLDTLDLSSCTSLTTVKVGNRNDLTDFSWLTLPPSVTTLDASGFTSLTSIDVPASVTNLNVSGCTGLTMLDLSGAALTSIDVSNNASLTALKLPETISSLNVADCPKLTIYFDGTTDEYSALIARLNLPVGIKTVFWGDHTYTIARGATVTLDEILGACGITAFSSVDVASISVSGADVLQVTDKTVKNLKSFTEPQTLTVTLTNGIVGTIKVACAALTESSNLNEFIDNHTVFMYEGETLAHQLSNPAITKRGDTLQLNLSFSEIPEGQEGDRQLKLLEPMTYTLPVGLTVDEGTLPSAATLRITSGEETRTYDASVTLGTNAETGAQTLMVTGSYGDDESWVRESSQATFTVPVTVRISTVPAAYTLGNNITLSAVPSRNPKVTSLTASAYDEENGTVTYTAAVEAENDIDDGATEYLVTIADLTTGDSPNLQFISGSYTYAHKAGFTPSEGAPTTQVNGVDALLGSATNFTQFPVTVAHMYDGDTITLTYTAKVLKGAYDKDTQHASVQNTVTLANNDASGKPNPSNNTDDDTKSVTTENIPYTPLTREYLAQDGSWAYWKVTINPSGYMINGGESLTLVDTFDDKFLGDAEQSIDYSSIAVTSAGNITYDYSGSTGTFIIPDSTSATITYRTRITAQPGEARLFRGTAVLKDADGNSIASSTAGVTEEAVAIYPSASDVTNAGSYMVKLYVYGEKAMQKGIEGAEFILLDANQRALEYRTGENKGKPVSFTTDSNGYANIELHEEEGDVSIEKNTGYYLEMMHAVDGYQKDNTLYSFMITDDPSYSTGGFYKYFNGDTMKVRLYPPSPGLSVSIRFSGSYTLSEEQQNNVTAVLQKWVDNGDGVEDENDWAEVERHPYTDSQWGAIKFNENLYDAELQYQNIYRVVEENQNPWDLPEDIHLETTYYSMVNTASSEAHNTEPQEFYVSDAGDSVNVVIDNRYEEPELTIVKMDKHSGEVLPGAVFSVYKIVNGAATGEVVTTYTTNESGELVVRGGEYFESETLYGITETQAPDCYLLPLEAEWHYFYFCNDDFLEPSILENLPEGAIAVNLTDSGDRIAVDNQKEVITIPVMKLWQGGAWLNHAEVVIGLYQSVAGGEVEPVLDENNTPRTLTLSEAQPYNNTSFQGLPSRDDQNRNITYSIKEESINGIDPLEAGYIQEYGTSSAGVYVVRNKPATSLTVSKQWYDFNGNQVTDPATLAQQSNVTFDIYRTTTRFTDSDPVDGITNADVMAFVAGLTKVREHLSFGASDDWRMSIHDLDEQDDLGNRYYYYVLEVVPSFGNEVYEVDDTSGTITIKNKIAPGIKSLTITKAELKDDPRPESLDGDFEFVLKLKKDDAHPIRKWQVYTDPVNHENDLVTDWIGEVHFKLKPTNPTQLTPDASITLNLPDGVTATVSEVFHPEYTVATSATVDGTAGDNGRTFTYDTAVGGANPVSLTYTNTLHVVCKVVKNDGTHLPFETLKRALKYIRDNPDSFSSPWTIYMLEDYDIPATDGIDLREGEILSLTTAPTTDTLFPFKPGEETSRAVITRAGVGDSILKNKGTLTLHNVCLDGGKSGNLVAAGDGGLVNSTGTLNLNAGATLRNSAADGKGGAVYAEGTVNIRDDASITGNSASSASALYMKGALNITGGSITGNTGANDGAVVVENPSDAISLSGSPVINDNTNAQNKAANLYIGVDSDNTVNVVAPGLAADARVGITAMEGHMAIGEQFSSAEFEQTGNLESFINDVYGYRGKLKDGTSTNVVWDGLTIAIKKEVASLGANPNDRFTIVLSSPSIIMGTYVIDGTLDYLISAARLNRPGRITLKNVKAGDEIAISPLPVGNYTIVEEASNYTPSYVMVETGSGETPSPIEDGTFTAYGDETVTVTNTRKLAPVKLTKALDDRLAGEDSVNFDFTVQLAEANGTPVRDFELAQGIITDGNGKATFAMSPKDAVDDIKDFLVPVGATMTITETVNPDYRITASAHTAPAEGGVEDIDDLNTTDDNVFAFQVTEAGAEVGFENERKLAEIELSKTLVGKVSKVESFTFTLTLKKGTAPVANYDVYKDEANPENNITTGDDGKATVPFIFGENDADSKSITLTIPDGTRLEVEEAEVKKDVGGSQKAIYNTACSINGAAPTSSRKAIINSVSETDKSIAFTNTRKSNTIAVKNTVNGYSGNAVPFTYTATVTDGGEDAYSDHDFVNGSMTFELATRQTKTLTVPYGATLTVTEGFIVGYGTTVKRGGASAVEALSDTFVVTANMSSSSPLLFTNNQLIGLQLVNNTSSKLEIISVTVGDDKKIYRVNADKTGQVELGTKTAALDIEPGKTAILEVQHDTSATAEQDYSVSGSTPAAGYYYTITNEPSFHESANPAIQRVYDTSAFEVKGKLRYSVQDSTVTFTEQPLVSFDSNGGVWTTEMDGYRDRNGDRKVYQKAVTTGEKVSRPAPDPVYPTAEGIKLLGWTADEAFAEASHTAEDDMSSKAYDFNVSVTEPVTLYAVWAKPAGEERVVTVKNGHNENLTVAVTLTQNNNPVGNHAISDGLSTGADGKASFTLSAGESKNLRIPNGVKLVFDLENASLAASSGFDFVASDDNKSYTIGSVDRDGTLTFIPGVCKITDSAGNVLYDGTKKPAVYETLDAAFTAYTGTLYTDASSTTTATPAAVKMLVDEYEITKKHTFPDKNMMLTTAGKADAEYPFLGSQERATLYRDDFTTDSLFVLDKAKEIDLTNIILNGSNISVAKTINGGLINVNKNGAKLTIGVGATLCNSVFAGYDGAGGSGGAIYIESGTLNVNGGLFSKLYAKQGGAIYAKSNAQLSIKGNGICFDNCNGMAADGDGGAIYYNVKKPLSINGGSEKENPGVVFKSCVSRGDTGSGGAIYATTSSNDPVTVSGCSFIECSARTMEGGNAGNGGGAVCANGVSAFSVSDCKFTACDTLSRGGAIVAMVKNGGAVSITNSPFDSCSCRGQGGALAVYQPNMESDSPSAEAKSTKLSMSGCQFSRCSSGTNNGSGGAIQCYLPCMDFSSSTFTDCWAGKEGGAINNYYGKVYLTMWSGSYLSLNGCRFVRCRAEDRFEPNARQHYGGAFNSKVMTVTVTDSYFEDCVSTLREGGALHLGGRGPSSKATITGSTFKNCIAKEEGGALLASNETLEITNSYFYGCGSSTSNGGAVYHGNNSREEEKNDYNSQSSTTITNCIFSTMDGERCYARNDGGAIWTQAETVIVEGCRIDGCSAGGSGGAVYLSKNIHIAGKQSNAAILDKANNGAITNCWATNGSAVFAEDKATFSGNLSVSGNTVSNVNGGAIQAVDTGKLYFEENVTVENNTCSTDSVYDHDVLMQIDGNTIINTTSKGLGVGARIGIYVSDPNNAYAKHGKEDQPFGTHYDSDTGSNYLDAFFNDRDSELYGYQGANDHQICWGIYICKITDADGNTLKRPNGRDAIYQRLSMAFDEFTQVKTAENETDKAFYIKMLVENYAIKQDAAVSNFPAEDITLTTASKTDAKHPYRGTEGTVSTISRTNNTNPLFNLSTESATFRLQDITLDGRKDKTAAEGDYKLVTASAGEIVVNSGTTLQYAKGDNGAAITGVQVTINGVYDTEKMEPTVKITNCRATGKGGAISTKNLTITNNSEESDKYGTSFTNCASGSGGGAIYASGTTVTMSGVSFAGCSSTDEGGVLFHDVDGSGATTIQKSVFVNGRAIGGSGGAVSSKAASLAVGECSFEDCWATANGGAINHAGTMAITITDTTFNNCETSGAETSLGFGGSVYTMANTVTLTGDSFQKSTAINNGGALYCASSAEGSTATISGTVFENCSTKHADGSGGAIYSMNKELTLQDYAPVGGTAKASAISACTAPGFSGAVHMASTGSTLNVSDGTVISGCYADMGAAIYLSAQVTMNLTDSPEFTLNGYTIQNDTVIDATAGACIYLEEGSRINLSGSPKFTRNILPNRPRIANGGVTDNVRQDIFLAGYASNTPRDTNATSIYVVGELTGDTIWVWPEMSPHKKPNEQFAKIKDDITVSADSLSKFRNALADGTDVGDDHDHTDCTNGEYLAGVQVGEGKNVYWDKMYIVSFKKIDNKGVRIPGAGFTLYSDSACRNVVATAFSADGEDDTDAQGKLLARGIVEFSSIRIGAYYMKETTVPTSFKDNTTTYLVLVGSPYLYPNEDNKKLWEGNGPLNVADAATLVARHTKDAGKFVGVFPLDVNNKAVLRANLASNSVGIENIRNDYQASFMKVDGPGAALPGAAFTIYSAILDDDGRPETFEDGYPKLMRWSRDGENYPAPVVSADGTAAFKDKDNKPLPKGMVYFRDLPLGTYYLLETAYPERDGSSRRTYYVESDRVFKLDIVEVDPESGKAEVILSEWKGVTEGGAARYEKLSKVGDSYVVDNQEAVCKLTDTSDKLLYAKGHEVWENEEDEPSARLLPAIYSTLEEGFDAAQNGTFVYANGNKANVDNALKLKVLKDFTISRPVTYNSSRKITFTTAETRVSKDRYIFSTTRTSDTSRAQITRAYNEDTSNDANAGALITLADGADMTLQSIRLIGRANINGRAIHVTGSSVLSILSNTMIERFTQTAVEGSSDQHNVQGGAILLDDGTSLTINGGSRRTAILENNSIQNSRVTGDHTGADGGAIAVGANCTFSITNAQFKYNSATSVTEKKGNGGAVSINKTRDADEMMKLPIYNVVFTGNKASYQGGALRVAENCNLIVDNCTFTNNKANTSSGANDPGEGGAIAVLSKADSPSVLTINGGTFTGNSASGSKGGAVKIGGFGMLTLSGSLSMSGNSAAYGGAVTIAPGAQVTMTQGTIKNNTATGSGGAFYVEGTEADKWGSLIVSGGSITDNKAAIGSAIYTEDFASATVTNASITGNKASGTDGGAINVGGPNARLHFGGAPTVFGNRGALGEGQQMNVVLSEDTNAVVNTTQGGLNNGIIGVYVVDETNAVRVFEGHGLPGKPFGTFGDTESRLNPQVFRSDHALSLYGVRNENEPSDKTIYWVDVICKLTDANGNILYQDIDLMINGKKETRKAQAVYARITAPNEADRLLAQNGFNALRDGFEAAQGTLYTKDGTPYQKSALTLVNLKMLKDVVLDKSIQYQGIRKVAFTTAEAGISTTMKKGGDYFAFGTDRLIASGVTDNKALITRGFGGDSMIVDEGTALTLSDITLDGAGNQRTTSADGGVVNVAAGSKLTVTDGATLQNSSTTGNGGAIYVAAGGTVTVNGGSIAGNAAANGAGIYLPVGGTLELSGRPSFGGTDRVTQKELDDGTVIGKVVNDLKGADGNYVQRDESFKTEDGKEPTNGGKQYVKVGEHYLVRQDIYMAGTASPITAINVTGEIASDYDGGTIWVWADNVNHYEMLKQFAVFSGDGTGLSETAKESTMRAFRNAQPDTETNCGGDYLTGQKGKETNCIDWTGGYDFSFMKIDSFGKAREGATFTLYTSYTNSTNNMPYKKGNDTVTATSSDGLNVEKFPDPSDSTKAQEEGMVLFSKIAPRKYYYMVETKMPEGFVENTDDVTILYRVEIGNDGTSKIERKLLSESDQKYVEVYKAKKGADNQYQIMNTPKDPEKVILRKVGASDNTTYKSLEGAQFQIFRYDGTSVSSGTDSSGNPITTFTSGSSGVYFIDTLPYGTYYLYEQEEAKRIDGTETSAYSGNRGKWFVLTVPNPNPDDNGGTSEVTVVEVNDDTVKERLAGFVK